MKIKFALIWILFLCFNLLVHGQGTESFTNCNATGLYTDGSYLGDNNITWSYVQSRNEGMYPISGKGLLLRNTSSQSKIYSSAIPNGIGNFTCKLRKGLTGAGNRQVELFINNISQGKSIAWDNDEVQTFNVNTLNITGEVIIEIRNITAYQVVIDDISWTAASTAMVTYCNLASPPTGNITTQSAFDVLCQVFEDGVTEVAGPSNQISAWVGYSMVNNHPNLASWTWIPATYNGQVGDTDEYTTNIGSVLFSGTYYYVSRFQIDNGPYSYGGYNASGGGFWDGSSNISGKLSVDTVDFCTLQFPGNGTINVGDSFTVSGQVFEQNITPGPDQGVGIEAEIGYSMTTSHPETWTNWIPATYNAVCTDCNSGEHDEYSADIGASISEPGTYHYATRFRLNNGIWQYGGILANGLGGGFWDGTTYISGVLEAMAPEIKVEGNLGKFPEIVNGDSSPQGTDNTLFKAQFVGASQTKTYRIRNLGNSNLTISNVTISGANSGDFMITIYPESTISPESFTILEIEFSPLEAGVRNATVSIINSDSDENPYTFDIRGSGKCTASSFTLFPNSGLSGTIVTITGTNFDSSSQANINGIPMTPNIINSTTMEVRIPENAHTGNISVVDGLGCTITLPFKIIDYKIAGCEGGDFLPDLIISEVTDATFGGLNYVEIYNGTGNPINLSDYSIEIFYNGNLALGNSVVLNAIPLSHNATFILALGVDNTSTPNNICPQAGGNGQLANQMSALPGINKKDNEHDMIRLLKANGTVVVDQFGIYGDNGWMDNTIVSGDRGFNFRRINTPLPLPTPNFDLNAWQVIDWVGSGSSSCPTNDYSDIGIFDFSAGTPPTVEIHPAVPTTNCYLSVGLNVSALEGFPGSLPLTYQWFYNAPGTSDWYEITNSNPDYSGQQSPTLVIENTLPLTGYQYYVQIRENTVTCYTTSASVRLHHEQTLWDGVNWHPKIPDHSTIAILNNNYTTSTITGSFTTCSLIVNSGNTLTIADNFFIEVINDVMAHGNSATDFGAIIVESKGSFVQRGNDSNAGLFKLDNTAHAQLNKNTYLKQKWYDYTYWGTPVTNETVESVLYMASPSRRFIYNAANFEDINGDDVDDNGDVWQKASGTMIPGKGYASTSNKSGAFPRVDTTTFNGPFNTGNIPVTIYGNSLLSYTDWNFISNPYPSAIDFHSLYNENSHVIGGSAYLWSQASPPNSNNPGNDVLNFNGNDYAIITIGSGNTAGGTGEMPLNFIPSAQGFFVVGANDGGTLTFKNSMRMGDAVSNQQFFKKNDSAIANKLWVNLTSDNGVFNQILIAYVEGATNAYDGFAFDAERNLSSGLSAIIYTEIPESHKKYAIQGKDPHSITVNEEIPIGFRTSITQPTLYKLSIAQTQGPFFDAHPIFIKDNFLNIYHDLTNNPYSFTSIPGEFNSRFTVVFQNDSLSTDEMVFGENQLCITELNNGDVEFLIRPDIIITSVEIMDILGRRLSYLLGSHSVEIYNLNHLNVSTYIAIVTLANGQTITKRFIKRR